jgi:ABC-2 type transport system ATP-binding protein
MRSNAAPVNLPLVEVEGASRMFGERTGLRDARLRVYAGEVHALLGPNGAGKTTLLRILAGLLVATSGTVRVAGEDPAAHGRELRRRIGFVPAGDRSFYLRLSALENLIFFARLHGFGLKQARARAREVLDRVGLADVARGPKVGLFSHGMQKRLSVARAFLTDPRVLLVDEATHDLDPEGALRVRELVAGAAAQGAAVVWATQRLDEIRGLAAAVTLLHEGTSRFTGSVDELAGLALPRRYLLQVRNGGSPAEAVERRMRRALGARATISRVGDAPSGSYLLDLGGDTAFGEAVGAIARQRIDVLAVRHETSELEQAFLALVGGGRR